MSETIGLAALETTDGTALFLAAARRRNNEFAISRGAEPAIARICAALDGLPLALELAAARTELLTVQELAERLDQAVTNLGPGLRDAPARHRTLQTTIDWSYRLLDQDQQRALVRFAVFAGGATVDAALAVTDASLETLEALTAKSLIDRRRRPDGTTRLIMLETVRGNALQRLAGQPDSDTIYRGHFEHYLQLAQQFTARLETHAEHDAMTVLDADVDNLHAAFSWALETAPNSALRLAGHLGQYWKIRDGSEGLRWLDAALEAAGSDAGPQDRARAQLERSHQLKMRQRRSEADEAAAQALALFRQAQDLAGTARACCACAAGAANLGNTELSRAYVDEACRLARMVDNDALLGKTLARLALTLPVDQRATPLAQARELLTKVGDYEGLAGAYLSAAYSSLTKGRLQEALSLLDVAQSALPKLNNPATEMFVFGNLGLAKLFSGELLAARTAFERQLQLCVGKAFRFGADEGLVGLAAVSAAQGQPEQAAKLRGAGRALGYPQPEDNAIDRRLERDYFSPARAACGLTAWRRAERAGAGLSYEAAIDLALHRSRPARLA